MDKVKPLRNEDSSIHIILVDDDQVLRDTMRELLKKLGYVVATAAGGNEAIALMKRFFFDLVITDYAMPEMNGVEFASLTRKIVSDTPIVLYTGYIDLIDEQQIAEAGITEVLRKPCRMKELDSIIKKVMAEKKEGIAIT